MLDADTAVDLMTPNPVSLRADATIQEAVALLADKGFHGAPVIDEAGLPVGVLSQTDILVHDREFAQAPEIPEFYERIDLKARTGERFEDGFHVEKTDYTRVSDVMTPVVFSVAPETSAAEVVRELLAMKVHRLFVVDETGVLIGVISGHDILRRLHG